MINIIYFPLFNIISPGKFNLTYKKKLPSFAVVILIHNDLKIILTTDMLHATTLYFHTVFEDTEPLLFLFERKCKEIPKNIK